MTSGLCTCASEKENPLCKSTCINTDGSYRCECSNGYNLLSKGICIGKSCEHDILYFPCKEPLMKHQKTLTKLHVVMLSTLFKKH